MSDSAEGDNLTSKIINPSNVLPQDDPETTPGASDSVSRTPDPRAEFASREKSPNKRKAGDAAAWRLRTRRKKRYRNLYDSHIEDVNSLPPEGHGEKLKGSQIGASIWTAEEKDIFFHALARKGRHDNKGIAGKIGSKSELEVVQYIELLRKALRNSELSLSRPTFVKRPQYEAAHEISVECTSILEQAAEILQETESMDLARDQQDQFWLLTPKVNKSLEKCMQEAGENRSELSQILPAATLLKLRQFLKLSERIFMNSSDLERNWRSYAGDMKSPAILQSAFVDLHNLATSITKRLVHSTLCLAMSRLRAVDVVVRPTHRIIKKQDVLAALDVLGMTDSSRPHWVGVARKHRLQVYDNVTVAEVSEKFYSYDEVEELLSSHSKINRENHETTQEDDADNGDCESVPSDPQSGSGPDNDVEIMDESSGSERSPPLPHADNEEEEEDDDDDDDDDEEEVEEEEPLSKEEQEDERRDEILEKLDQRRSQAEEARLWELLGEDPPSSMNLEDEDDEKLQVQAAPRKDRIELVDWTSWTDYAAEWETLETPVPEEAFRANRVIGKGGVDAPEPRQ